MDRVSDFAQDNLSKHISGSRMQQHTGICFRQHDVISRSRRHAERRGWENQTAPGQVSQQRPYVALVSAKGGGVAYHHERLSPAGQRDIQPPATRTSQAIKFFMFLKLGLCFLS